MKITWIEHSSFRIEKDGYTIVTDPVCHRVFDVIVEGRAKKDIRPWFEANEQALQSVEKLAMDMSASYASVATELMPMRKYALTIITSSPS